MGQRAGRPDSERAAASRRLVLVAAGGVMLAVAADVGWKHGGHGDTAQAADRDRLTWTTTAGRSSPEATRSAAHSTAAHPAASPTASPTAPSPAAASSTASPTTAPTTNAGAGAFTTPDPVYYLDDGPMTIALTIDDGPSPLYTPQVLRILEKYKVTASFSMVGENVSYYPSVARDVAAAGHLIVNHTWDHSDLTQMSASRARTEIARATEAIHSAVGKRPEIFRAPYGAWSRAALDYCATENLMPLDWSVDPRDWARPGVRKIVRNIMANTQTGSIILEHDGGGDRAQTVAALKVVIPRLLDKGYLFRPV